MRWRPIVALIGLFFIGLVAGIIASPRQDEHQSTEVGDGVHAKSLEQVREEPVETAALEERHQPESEDSRIERNSDQAKLQMASLNEQLVEMQEEVDRLRQEVSDAQRKREEVDRLRQEVSDAQRKLTQERETAALLRTEAVQSGGTREALEKRVEELSTALEEREYLMWKNAALAYAYRKEPEDEGQAEAAFKTAIRIAEQKHIQDPALFNAYALFLQERGRLEQAEQAFETALEIDPAYDKALFNLGALYELQGRFTQAMAKYKAAGEAGEKRGSEEYVRLRSMLDQ